MRQFVDTMGVLGEKLGPMVLQFPFFGKDAFKSQTDFLDRLIPFLKTLPQGHRFAVEIRNKEWIARIEFHPPHGYAVEETIGPALAEAGYDTPSAGP